MKNRNLNTNKSAPKRRFEDDGDFFVGSVGNGDTTSRLLCFRNRITRAVGASTRFSREEAWRKSRRGVTLQRGGAAA